MTASNANCKTPRFASNTFIGSLSHRAPAVSIPSPRCAPTVPIRRRPPASHYQPRRLRTAGIRQRYWSHRQRSIPAIVGCQLLLLAVITLSACGGSSANAATCTTQIGHVHMHATYTGTTDKGFCDALKPTAHAYRTDDDGNRCDLSYDTNGVSAVLEITNSSGLCAEMRIIGWKDK